VITVDEKEPRGIEKECAQELRITRQGRLEDSPKCPLTRGRGVEAGTSALPGTLVSIGWAEKEKKKEPPPEEKQRKYLG
jgi:hypothetical protein